MFAVCLPVFAGAPSIDGFEDAIDHWQSKRGETYARHDPANVDAIADNLLLLQRDHGGWVQNRDPLQMMSPDDVAQLLAEKAEPGGSFDNRNIFTQIEYLMGAFAMTGTARYRDGAARGLDYLIAHQFANCGGWPHTVPASTAYQSRLTIADEVFSGPLTLLRRIAGQNPPFDSINAETQATAAAALARGDDCLLRLQVRQDGRLAGWAGQYDPVTEQPMGGRSFELPAIVAQETVAIVRYLMSIETPSGEVMASVDGAVSWLRAVQIEGVRLETVSLETETPNEFLKTKSDRRLVSDASAPPLWARFYDLADNTVVLANRDGVRVARYDQVLPERRSGYSWYGDWPAKLLARDYPAWHCRVRGTSVDDRPCR